MIYVSVQYNQYRSYTQTSNCIITGVAFYRDNLYKGNDLIQLISPCEKEEQFIDRLKQLNGFFALIKHNGHQLFAAVDRVRSIPLFYGQKGNDFFLSDSAEWVCQQVGNNRMDPLAREEFLLTGYVTGSDTLFPDVKQLQAGEALCVHDDGKNININTIRYYRFVHKNETQKSIEDLMDEHDQVLLKVFKRLIRFADGRTVVVPLSGGYDSRLIVLMLKRLKYDKVFTFSYGRPGNKESKVSSKIAKSLGLQWGFVEYSNKLWYKWYHTDEYNRYSQFANGLTSVPHIQDWPAVWKLKSENIIPIDSIFVPGHTGDFISGGHIPAQFEKLTTVEPDFLIDCIMNKHYVLNDINDVRDANQALIRNKIINLCESDTLLHVNDAASTFEKWELEGRQAKFIINSVRVYEFWGYDWLLPFWDYECMQCWCNVPFEFRIKQIMYKQFVNDLYYKFTSEKVHNDLHKYNILISVAKKIIKFIIKSNRHLRKISPNIYFYYHNKNHPLGWYGAFDNKFIQKYYSGKDNINSLLALQIIDELGGMDN